jgi:hypothetical protein
MYQQLFNNLSGLNRNQNTKTLVKSQSNYIENIMKCSYCEDRSHTIIDCPFDRCIDKILDSRDEPDFNNLTLKSLKRIASVRGIKVSLSKIEYVLMFKKIWLKNKKEREEEKQKLKETIDSLNRIENDNQENCPVCMEPIGKINSCVSKCGHKFCLECLLKSYRIKNNCPMCRKSLTEEDYDDLPELIEDTEDFIPFDESQISSQDNILNYINYIENSETNRIYNNIFYIPRQTDGITTPRIN